MIELRKVLTNLLKEHHPRVAYEDSSKEMAFPYLVFDLPNSFPNEGQEIFNLDVDIWDETEDTCQLEQLSSTIWKALNHYHHIDNNMQFSIYQVNRLAPDDPDPRIKRRKLIFTLKYISRR